MRRRSQCLALVAALVLAGCSGGSHRNPMALPGPVPDGVTFISPAADAPTAPKFELTLLDGATIDITEQWDQRPVVLVFLEPWCQLCADQQKEINKIAEEYRDVVLFLGIGSSSTVERMNTYVRDNKVVHPVGIDATGEIWRKYRVEEPPLVALISKGGKLLRGWPGGTDTLRQQISDLLVSK